MKRYIPPLCLTKNVPLEKDAAKKYTRSVYYDVRREIRASGKICLCKKFVEENGYINYTIVDTTVNSMELDVSIDRTEDERLFDELIPKHSEVILNKPALEITCSCMKFERFGLLCRHIFYVLRMARIHEIPSKYICPRWTPYAVPIDTLGGV